MIFVKTSCKNVESEALINTVKAYYVRILTLKIP